MAKAKKEEKSHKELRKEYTYNKLKGLGQEIIEEIEKNKVPRLKTKKKIIIIKKKMIKDIIIII